jgi:hypothetical protein
MFDHSSVLATVEDRFGLQRLTNRDGSANTLDIALNLANPRLLPTEALLELPQPAPDTAVAGPADVSKIFAANPKAALSSNQKTMAALALACDLQISPPELQPALISNHQKLVEQADATEYIQNVEARIAARRASAPANP